MVFQWHRQSWDGDSSLKYQRYISKKETNGVISNTKICSVPSVLVNSAVSFGVLIYPDMHMRTIPKFAYCYFLNGKRKRKRSDSNIPKHRKRCIIRPS